MVKKISFFISLFFIFSLFTSPVWAEGGKVRSDKAKGSAGTTGGGETTTNRGQNQNIGSLNDTEIEHLIYMLEEEKLARDVYLALSETYTAQIFLNISESEQRHMDALKQLIEKHNLENSVTDDGIGKFTNPFFTGFYEQLTGSGVENYCDALQVGIDIEKLDIEDIEHILALVDDVVATDLIRVLNNLLNGSYNHLNSFTSQFEFNQCH